jgi:hypothetical protein
LGGEHTLVEDVVEINAAAVDGDALVPRDAVELQAEEVLIVEVAETADEGELSVGVAEAAVGDGGVAARVSRNGVVDVEVEGVGDGPVGEGPSYLVVVEEEIVSRVAVDLGGIDAAGA